MIHNINSLNLLGIAIIVTLAILSSTTTGAPLGTMNTKTMESMSSRLCGVNDNIGIDRSRSKRYVLIGEDDKWQKTDLTYYIETYSKKLSHQKVDEVIASALNVWSKFTDLTFKLKKPVFTVYSTGGFRLEMSGY